MTEQEMMDEEVFIAAVKGEPPVANIEKTTAGELYKKGFQKGNL